MKLVHTLAVAFLGTLLGTGCTVTDDTGTDGGTTTDGGGTDTAVTPTDTGVKPDVATETATDTGGGTCTDCLKANCDAEIKACAAKPKCVTGSDCLDKCATTETGTVADCRNTCVTNAGGDLDDYVACIVGKCKTVCGF